MRGLLIKSWPCISRVADSKPRAERSQWRGRQFSIHASARPILAWANGEPPPSQSRLESLDPCASILSS